jgi:hypothetical protein
VVVEVTQVAQEAWEPLDIMSHASAIDLTSYVGQTLKVGVGGGGGRRSIRRWSTRWHQWKKFNRLFRR